MSMYFEQRRGDLHGRPGGGGLRRLPQLLPFLPRQPEPVDNRVCTVVQQRPSRAGRTSAAVVDRLRGVLEGLPSAVQLGQGQIRGEPSAPSSPDGTGAGSPARPPRRLNHVDLHHQAPNRRHSPVGSADTPGAVTAGGQELRRHTFAGHRRSARPARARAAPATRRSPRRWASGRPRSGRSEAQRHDLLSSVHRLSRVGSGSIATRREPAWMPSRAAHRRWPRQRGACGEIDLGVSKPRPDPSTAQDSASEGSHVAMAP